MRHNTAILILATLYLLPQPTLGQFYHEGGPEDAQLGEQEARMLLARDSLVYFDYGTITRDSQHFVQILSENYPVQVRHISKLHTTDDPRHTIAYIQAFNVVMEDALERRYGPELMTTIRNQARLTSAFEEVDHWHERGIAVRGWLDAYPNPRPNRRPPVYPIMVAVNLSMEVCIDNEWGRATGVYIVGYHEPDHQDHAVAALQIVVGLRFGPVSGREIEGCSITVPVLFRD